jgi:hypothetical protein
MIEKFPVRLTLESFKPFYFAPGTSEDGWPEITMKTDLRGLDRKVAHAAVDHFFDEYEKLGVGK